MYSKHNYASVSGTLQLLVGLLIKGGSTMLGIWGHLTMGYENRQRQATNLHAREHGYVLQLAAADK